MSAPSIAINKLKQGEVTVKTSNGEIHRFAHDVANQMGAIKCMFPTLTESSVITLQDIESNTFELVLKWCNAVNSIKDTLDIDTARSMFKKLVQESIEDRIMIYKLILAANFLDIESLWGATTQHLADEINDCQTVDEIEIIFRQD